MTASQLRATVSTILAAHVGRYVREDNTIIPAVWVGARTPPGHRMDGSFTRYLEVVIGRSPRLAYEPLYGARVISRRSWPVIVKDWAPVIAPQATATGVAAALEALMASSLQLSSDPVIVAESDATIEQGTILVLDPILF